MANYYRVSPKFWLKARQRNWTDAQTTLALYLLTCEHRNLEGLYRLPKPYIASDLGWPARKVDETLATICETGFAAYDEDATMVLIPKALKHQAPSTERQIKGAVAQLERIPHTSLWDAFRIACQSHCQGLSDAIAVRWPSDSDSASRTHEQAQGDSISSSISNSSSSSPQPPADAGGAGVSKIDASLKANPRARGTNPRAVGRRLEAADDAKRSSLALAGLSEPSSEQRGEWPRLHTKLLGAVGENAVLAAYVEDLTLAAIDDGDFVIDGPDEAWGWATQRFRSVVASWANSLGLSARLASLDEHNGLAALPAPSTEAA